MTRSTAYLLTFLLVLGCDHAEPEEAVLECSEDTNLSLFEQRIEPLIDPSRPPSCERCHLPGTDFSRYIQPGDACKTMACLVSEELVDLENPDESKMLDWILRGHEEFAGALTTDTLVQGEYDAFKQWIEFSASCDTCETVQNPCGHPEEPDPDPNPEPEPPPGLTLENYPCDENGIRNAYADHLWPVRGRCNHCHSEFRGAPEEATKWMSSRTDRSGSDETADRIIRGGLVNLQDPEQSLIVLKPLLESDGGIPHEGGAKSLAGDPFDVSVRAWAGLVYSCSP